MECLGSVDIVAGIQSVMGFVERFKPEILNASAKLVSALDLRWLPKEKVYAVCSGRPYLRGTVDGHLCKENGDESALVLSYAVEESVEVLERHRPGQSYWYNDE